MPKHGNLPESGEKAPTLPLYMLQKGSGFPSTSLKRCPSLLNKPKARADISFESYFMLGTEQVPDLELEINFEIVK